MFYGPTSLIIPKNLYKHTHTQKRENEYLWIIISPGWSQLNSNIRHALGRKSEINRRLSENVFIYLFILGERYDENKMASLAKGISNEIREKLKAVYQRR